MARRFPKLRPVPWDGVVVLAVAVLAAALWLGLARATAADRLTAVVYVDGAEADRVVLDARTDIRRLYTSHGYTLEVEFTNGGAQVLHSECPTQVCVHTGRVTRSGQAIICLPAGLVVRLEGGGDDAPDTVLG